MYATGPTQILWTGALQITAGASDTFAPNDAFQLHLLHQSLNRAMRDIHAFTSEPMPDLAHAIHTEIIVPYPTNFIA